MDNLINETNERIQAILNDLEKIKEEYETKIATANKQFDIEVAKSKQYKREFFVAKAKIDKMNNDIAGFEEDYKNLVEKFKDDELANILIAANKEISSKVDERKRKILKDKNAMNELVQKAANVKTKLIRLTAEKKALEKCLNKILDAHTYYTKALGQILEYTNEHRDNLSSIFNEYGDNDQNIMPVNDVSDNSLDESILDDSILLDYKEISEALMDSNSSEEDSKNEIKEEKQEKIDTQKEVEKTPVVEKEEVKVEKQKKEAKEQKEQKEQKEEKKIEKKQEITEEVIEQPEESKPKEEKSEPLIAEDDEDIELDIQINELLDEIDESILDDDSDEDKLEEEMYLDDIDLDADITIEDDDDDDDEEFDEELEKILNANDSLD